MLQGILFVVTFDHLASENFQKVKGGGHLPEGDWRRVTELQSIAGVQYRKRNAEKFAQAVFECHRLGRPFGLLTEREPTNPVDPKAVKIIGWAQTQSAILGRDKQLTFELGYLDADTSGRIAEKYPHLPLAAEFYSLYQGRLGFIDICFILSAPREASFTSARSIRLIEAISDELLVLIYASKADTKLGRFEHEILGKYAKLRAEDLRLSLDDEEVTQMRRWCKNQDPGIDEVEAAIQRLAERPATDPHGLWEMIEIILTIDRKITSEERRVANELAKQIKLAFQITDLNTSN
jgi:hypothetical protein